MTGRGPRGDVKLAPPKMVNILRETHYSRLAKQNTQWQVDCKPFSDFKDNTSCQDRMPSNIKEVVCDFQIARAMGDNIKPNITDQPLRRRKFLVSTSSILLELP